MFKTCLTFHCFKNVQQTSRITQYVTVGDWPFPPEILFAGTLRAWLTTIELSSCLNDITFLEIPHVFGVHRTSRGWCIPSTMNEAPPLRTLSNLTPCTSSTGSSPLYYHLSCRTNQCVSLLEFWAQSHILLDLIRGPWEPPICNHI